MDRIANSFPCSGRQYIRHSGLNTRVVQAQRWLMEVTRGYPYFDHVSVGTYLP